MKLLPPVKFIHCATFVEFRPRLRAVCVSVRADVVRRRVYCDGFVMTWDCLFVCGYVNTIKQKPLTMTWNLSQKKSSLCPSLLSLGSKGQGSGAHGHHFELPSYLWNRAYSLHTYAPCGLRGCKNGPAPFPGRMSYKATKPGLVFVLVFIAPFYVLLVFIVCVVCLLVVLVKLSLLAKLLARRTPLTSESSPLQFLALA